MEARIQSRLFPADGWGVMHAFPTDLRRLLALGTEQGVCQKAKALLLLISTPCAMLFSSSFATRLISALA
jgi:hypothetical protein